MKNWFRQHGLALQRTLYGMLRHPLSNGLNLLVIAITTALPLILWLVVSSIAGVMDGMPVEPQLSIFLKSGVPSTEINSLQTRLGQDGRIASYRFIPKDEALKEMESATATPDLLAGLSENPLPDAFVITAKGNHASALEKLQAELKVLPAVGETQLDSDWARRLEQIIQLAHVIFVVAAVLLGTGLALITGNSIRMQILTRREEIEVARLIGATDSFIRRPFIHFALAQGLLGGVFASAIATGVILALNPAVQNLARAYNQQFKLHMPDPLTILVVCAMTIVLCLIGAWLSVWRNMRKFQ